MDKDILKYLDKVGQYVQGASEKGFEVYVHGVFVNSISMTLIGLIIISAIVITCYKLIKKYFETDEYNRMDLDDLFFCVNITFTFSNSNTRNRFYSSYR